MMTCETTSAAVRFGMKRITLHSSKEPCVSIELAKTTFRHLTAIGDGLSAQPLRTEDIKFESLLFSLRINTFQPRFVWHNACRVSRHAPLNRFKFHNREGHACLTLLSARKIPAT